MILYIFSIKDGIIKMYMNGFKIIEYDVFLNFIVTTVSVFSTSHSLLE